MNRLFIIIILALGLTVPAFAKTKKADAPLTYPLTGTVAFSSFNSDSSASMTVNGQTYNAYCSTESTNVSCTDIPGVFEVTLADGTLVLVGTPALQWSGKDAGNPVLESRHAAQPGRFSYRLVEHPYAGSMTQFFCVPNSRSGSGC